MSFCTKMAEPGCRSHPDAEVLRRRLRDDFAGARRADPFASDRWPGMVEGREQTHGVVSSERVPFQALGSKLPKTVSTGVGPVYVGNISGGFHHTITDFRARMPDVYLDHFGPVGSAEREAAERSALEKLALVARGTELGCFCDPETGMFLASHKPTECGEDLEPLTLYVAAVMYVQLAVVFDTPPEPVPIPRERLMEIFLNQPHVPKVLGHFCKFSGVAHHIRRGNYAIDGHVLNNTSLEIAEEADASAHECGEDAGYWTVDALLDRNIASVRVEHKVPRRSLEERGYEFVNHRTVGPDHLVVSPDVPENESLGTLEELIVGDPVFDPNDTLEAYANDMCEKFFDKRSGEYRAVYVPEFAYTLNTHAEPERRMMTQHSFTKCGLTYSGGICGVRDLPYCSNALGHAQRKRDAHDAFVKPARE